MSDDIALTQLLRASQQGDAAATDRLIPLIYDRLHAVAGAMMRHERPDHTLSATALLHESYIRLFQAEIEWDGRTHFFRLAACMMRRILVDHAKARRREKRGGGAEWISLDDPLKPIQVADPAAAIGILELDEALSQLARQDERKAQIVELVYFGGLTYEEAAAAMEISPATLHRDLRLAKAWLQTVLTPEPRP
ncbi:sigma-70 family RNA polymerase sigma factor [Paludibaculum fermentans]|uniref:Sigma-70 family RNA polymerase sigma factor n=1 Tax=Paludibaculum fermentans TaxID=1473598 RepID=A0A7S7NRH3_PALFE|nr:sigma-70 family RNA polymerase sigma factor [Paludibaculum fermentans]QOY88486.1 sigma-70 family RNA polymerase sigma factor [Paludibaculum fermentans]